MSAIAPGTSRERLWAAMADLALSWLNLQVGFVILDTLGPDERATVQHAIVGKQLLSVAEL